MATTTAKITLQCVKSGKKLRIRFFSFTDEAGKVFTNVYNNGLNCKFPRDIRVEGRFFEIGPNDLELVNHPGKSPFYSVKTGGIKIIDNIDISTIKVFPVDDCVICMSEKPALAFAPCGHLCTCTSCWQFMAKSPSGKSCPLCRRSITTTIAAAELPSEDQAD